MDLLLLLVVSQLSQFKTINELGQSVWISGDILLYSIIFVLFTMSVIWFLPKLTKAIPSTLVAILATTLIGAST